MPRPYLVITLLALSAMLRAQDASLVPVLRKDLRNAPNDTVRAETLALLCFNLIRSQPDSARYFGIEALSLAERIGNIKALADAHNNLGWLDNEQGHLRAAEVHLQQALALFQQLKDPGYISTTQSNIGWVLQKKGDSVGALERFLEALKMAEQAKDSSSTAILLYSIGTTYRRVKDGEHAKEFYRRSLSMEEALGRKNKVANCIMSLGNIFYEEGDTAEAHRQYNKAFDLYSTMKDHYGMGLVEENVGALTSEHDPARTLVHYRIALGHYRIINSSADLAYIMDHIASMYIRLGQLAAADTTLSAGMFFAKQAGEPSLLMEYELTLAELASKRNNGQATYDHFQRYLTLKDSLEGEGTQRELARLRTEFESEQKEKDNTILRAQNDEQRERIKRRDLQLYGSIALGALALFAAVLFRRNFKQKKKNVEVLNELNERLARSNAEISEINSLLEMKVLRSQMNPHFIYNCLNSAARMTQAGQSTEALAYLQGFAKLLRTVLDHSVKDRITIAEEVDFLRQYLKLEAHRLEGLTYEVDADRGLLEDEAELPALLVQPFVENAIWHGLSNKEGLRSIKVEFKELEGGITCTITDNGVGREEAAATPKDGPTHRSLGMELTSERLRLLARRMDQQRSFAVEDLNGVGGAPSGTRVTLRL